MKKTEKMTETELVLWKDKIDKLLIILINQKERGLKSIKYEMKKNLQWTPQKYKGS